MLKSVDGILQPDRRNFVCTDQNTWFPLTQFLIDTINRILRYKHLLYWKFHTLRNRTIISVFL